MHFGNHALAISVADVVSLDDQLVTSYSFHNSPCPHGTPYFTGC